ncbi:MAG: hypothetical protein EXR63_05560 [Dehalococcoidia bacterium]|nr:hypothetical protein [Dehalococcoidia bacterium]
MSTAAATRAAGSGTAAGGAGSPLAAVNDQFSKVKSFRATIAIEAGGQKQEGTIESVQPDRLHVTILGLEIISIGKDSWIKAGPTWTKQTGTGFGAFQAPDVAGTISGLTGPGVVASGTDTVNGKRCDVFKSPAVNGATSEACVADGLPLRVVTESAAGKTTVVFTDYNKDIKIEAPN